MHGLKPECEDVNQSHIERKNMQGNMKLRGARKTIGNVLKSGLHILTTMEMLYATSQNTLKYH